MFMSNSLAFWIACCLAILTTVLTFALGLALRSLLQNRPKLSRVEGQFGESYRTPGRQEEEPPPREEVSVAEAQAERAIRQSEASHKAAQKSKKAAYWALALSLINVGLWLVRAILKAYG